MKKKKYILIPTLVTFLILGITGFYSLDLTKTKPVIIPLQTTLLVPVPLASAAYYTILAGTSINNLGDTHVVGKIGLSPGDWVGGFTNDVFVYTNKNAPDKSNQAKLDLTTAYSNASARKSNDAVRLNGNIGGLTLTPGLYHSNNSLQIASGNLTFDALGKKEAIFIIQIESTLITRPYSKVILKGGALASNIFWQVGNTATFGSDSIFKGTILANKSIVFYSGASLDGRALARTGEVDLASNEIDKH